MELALDVCRYVNVCLRKSPLQNFQKELENIYEGDSTNTSSAQTGQLLLNVLKRLRVLTWELLKSDFAPTEMYRVS
jgi:hypothetical protein